MFRGRIMLALGLLGLSARAEAAPEVQVDLSGYRPECGVEIRRTGDRLEIGWPIAGGERGLLVLDLRPDQPLVESLGIASEGQRNAEPIVRDARPEFAMTLGTRVAPPGRPPEMSEFNVFFDTPATRPHRRYPARLDPRRVRGSSEGRRATVALGDLTIGPEGEEDLDGPRVHPFRGELRWTFYSGSRLIHLEAVVRTEDEHRAFLYDAGLTGEAAANLRVAWLDPEGQLQSAAAKPSGEIVPVAVRHRTIVAETANGSLACFPPPHQFFFPRDLTDNVHTAWYAPAPRFGIGIRQDETGGGSFVPWFNAPPGTDQRLGVFFLVTRGRAQDTIDEVLRYTHHDRFPALPGHVTFTSHWHMAIAVAAMQEQAKGSGRTIPDFVGMFKDMGVNIVHLAEFHGDGHPQDPGPLRRAELEALFTECQRLSDDQLLLLPGEEANVYLGLNQPGKHPGHWLYLFPRPVAWLMKRGPGEPFAQEDPRFGTLYRVGSREDMIRLLEQEHGLAWTAHPRIKASSWTPDIYRDEDFFRADFWLGAAWKAMPADLSRPRLGERVLDLLSDMANWGRKKYVLGEVDVFKLNHAHELYGHMNINYLKLDRVPKYDGDWRPICDALRNGRFFVTTGEVVIRDFRVGGHESGSTWKLSEGERPEVRVALEWTFPLRFVELVSGDGQNVYRDRIDLADTGSFGHRALTLTPDLRGRTWVRLEAWDVATNGAFTQPVWLARQP
jgi:hypothetical protein